jgi:hypothetical protein
MTALVEHIEYAIERAELALIYRLEDFDQVFCRVAGITLVLLLI